MSSAANKEKVRFYETILSSPGMADKCKIVLQISRQNVLLLCRLIEAGILTKEKTFEDDILQALPKESGEEFKTIHEDILRRSDLSILYEKLKGL